MQPRTQHIYAGWGMILGTAIGGAIGIVFFALTGDATYIAITGVGTAIGLGIGAGVDQTKGSDRNGPTSPGR